MTQHHCIYHCLVKYLTSMFCLSSSLPATSSMPTTSLMASSASPSQQSPGCPQQPPSTAQQNRNGQRARISSISIACSPGRGQLPIKQNSNLVNVSLPKLSQLQDSTRALTFWSGKADQRAAGCRTRHRVDNNYYRICELTEWQSIHRAWLSGAAGSSFSSKSASNSMKTISAMGLRQEPWAMLLVRYWNVECRSSSCLFFYSWLGSGLRRYSSIFMKVITLAMSSEAMLISRLVVQLGLNTVTYYSGDSTFNIISFVNTYYCLPSHRLYRVQPLFQLAQSCFRNCRSPCLTPSMSWFMKPERMSSRCRCTATLNNILFASATLSWELDSSATSSYSKMGKERVVGNSVSSMRIIYRMRGSWEACQTDNLYFLSQVIQSLRIPTFLSRLHRYSIPIQLLFSFNSICQLSRNCETRPTCPLNTSTISSLILPALSLTRSLLMQPQPRMSPSSSSTQQLLNLVRLIWCTIDPSSCVQISQASCVRWKYVPSTQYSGMPAALLSAQILRHSSATSLAAIICVWLFQDSTMSLSASMVMHLWGSSYSSGRMQCKLMLLMSIYRPDSEAEFLFQCMTWGCQGSAQSTILVYSATYSIMGQLVCCLTDVL